MKVDYKDNPDERVDTFDMLKVDQLNMFGLKHVLMHLVQELEVSK